MERVPPTSGKRQNLGKRLLFVSVIDVTVLTALFVLGEVACRWIAPQAQYGALPPWVLELLQYSEDIYLGWELQPGKLDHNLAGFRGREYAEAKPPGVWRVAMIGDSVTYGLHVAAEKTFPHLLESKCNAAAQGPVEILNFGVPGYNSRQEYEILKTRVVGFDPDLVVMTFTPDDVETTPVVMNIGGEWSLFRNHFEGNHLLNNDLHWAAFRRSHLYRLFYKWTALALMPAGSGFSDCYVQPEAEWKNLLRVAELCRQRNIAFLLVLSPSLLPWELAEDTPKQRDEIEIYTSAFDKIRRFAAEAKIDAVDLAPLYKQYEGKFKIQPIDHEHLNPLGHQLAADYLLPKFLSLRAANPHFSP